VRRLCPHCKEQYTPPPQDLPLDLLESSAVRQRGLNDFAFYRPVGCPECRHTGYSGRIALYELLIATDEVRHLASEGKQSSEIKRAARTAGMMTLRENGWRKVLNGITSIDEVIRMAKED
jgi:type II secretory ATPase GspE/PulE/Tfp pilus assembly ATPase PilB-like protein